MQVRARKGYWALTVEDVEARDAGAEGRPAAEVHAGARVARADDQSRATSAPGLATTRAQDGKTRVTLLWEPLPPTPGVRRDEPRRVTVLATSASGDIVYRGRRCAGSELAAPGQRRHRSRFEAPPGNSICG